MESGILHSSAYMAYLTEQRSTWKDWPVTYDKPEGVSMAVCYFVR